MKIREKVPAEQRCDRWTPKSIADHQAPVANIPALPGKVVEQFLLLVGTWPTVQLLGEPPASRSTPPPLGALIRGLGVPTVTARTAALRQPVLQAMAPVVAQSLGFHRITAHRAVAEAGGTWSQYAAGNHSK